MQTLIQKKQVTAIIGIFMLMLMSTDKVYGQSFNQSLLINKKWQCVGPEGRIINFFTKSYTEKEELITFFLDNQNSKKEEIRIAYYLSDTIVNTFQPNLVGKSKTGKYIVTLLKGKLNSIERFGVIEILELTDTTLKIKNAKNERRGVVIGDPNAIVEYRAVR
jgi:hypothetical protein